MLAPMMPETAEKISELLGAKVGKEGDITFSSNVPSEPLFMRK